VARIKIGSGSNVVGPSEEKIGAISESFWQRAGRRDRASVAFLGIGQKDVAIPFKTLKWVSHEEAAAARSQHDPGEPHRLPLRIRPPLHPVRVWVRLLPRPPSR
jgi:hypothetical protein